VHSPRDLPPDGYDWQSKQRGTGATVGGLSGFPQSSSHRRFWLRQLVLVFISPPLFLDELVEFFVISMRSRSIPPNT